YVGDRDEAESRVLEPTLDRAGDDDLDLVGDLARPSRVCHGAYPLCRGRSLFSGPMVAVRSNRLRPITSGTDRSRERRPVSTGARAANSDQSRGFSCISNVSMMSPTRRSLYLPSPIPHSYPSRTSVASSLNRRSDSMLTLSPMTTL